LTAGLYGYIFIIGKAKGRLIIKSLYKNNMPKFDGTGPAGQGSRTGWGLGFCGAGMRRGWGCWGAYRRFISPKNELSALEEEEKVLEEELAAVREEKAALEGQK